LIEKSVLKGGVQLLRVTAGQHLLGIVYNLAHEGRVYFYQCGYNYPDDKRLSPGLVTLSYAIQYCLGAGFEDYDFLSGFASYKQRLSTGGRTLIWAALRRPSVKLRVLDGLRSVKQRFATENYALSKEL
jgi:CelD/BcsL family acetyltransferase involved in cellulose biosynthesis